MRTQRIRARAGCLAVAMTALTVLSGCAGDTGVRGDRAGTLRVGIDPDYPPIVYRDEDGLQGVEPELARMAAEALGLRAQFVELPFEGLIPSLERGEVDVVMSGLSITPERAERVIFTKPYLRVGQLGLIRRTDLARFGRPAAMRRRGARVGFVSGTTGEAFVRTDLPAAESYAFEDPAAGVRSLRAERIDFFIHDAPTIWRVTMEPGGEELVGLFRPLTDEVLAWAVARSRPRLAAQLDALLDEWRANNQLESVLNRWIPVRVQIGRSPAPSPSRSPFARPRPAGPPTRSG